MRKVISMVWILIVVAGILGVAVNSPRVSASSVIFFDDFNSGDYSNYWVAGQYAWYGYDREWISAEGDWYEGNGYLYGSGDGDWIYIYTKSKIPTRGIAITVRVKLENDSNAVIALIPDNPQNFSHIIAGAVVVAYPPDSGWYAFSGNGNTRHVTKNKDGSVVNGRWYTVKIVIPPDGSKVEVYDGDTGELKVVDDYYTVPDTTAYLVLTARGSWGSGANVTYDYVKVTSLTDTASNVPLTPVIYKDSILTFNIRDFSTLIVDGYDWLKNYPEPRLPYLWLTVSIGQPAYYSDFKNGYWEDVQVVSNNSEEVTYSLSTNLNGGTLGTIPFRELMTIYKNSGLIKIQRAKVLDNAWGVMDTINGISPGGDTANDYIASSEFGEHPVNYENTFCTGTSWTACEKYMTDTLKGYHGYVYLTVYDKQKKQGFAIIVPKEYIKDRYSDIRYAPLDAYFTGPTTYWKAWRWFISIATDGSRDVTYYWYFYKFTNDPTAPIKKLIDSGMNPEVAKELNSESSGTITQTTPPTSTQTSSPTTTQTSSENIQTTTPASTQTSSPTNTQTSLTSTQTSTLAPIASSAIGSAETIISQIPSSVNVSQAKTLLESAKKAYNNGDYELAKEFAETAQALAVKSYYDTLYTKLQEEKAKGLDTSKAESLLQQAYQAYQNKDYTKALHILAQADLALAGTSPSSSSNYYYIIGGLIVVGVAVYTLSRRKPKPAPAPQKQELPQERVKTLGTRTTTPTTGNIVENLSELYTNFELIGQGGFAWVYKARRKKDGKIVALKIPKNIDPVTGKSFLREITHWLHLKHPNIVELYDANVLPVPYLEMEYCDKPLSKLRKPMDVEQAAWIVFNIAEGLKYAHSKGIIHRDLKPSNVLLKNGIPKISDWGLSKVMSESKSSTTTTSFTLLYAAPEQLSKSQFGHTDERTDIWALGVIFYELVTGKLPFDGTDLGEITFSIIGKDPVPPSRLNPEAKLVEPIIMKTLAKRKEERYGSVEELQRDLAKVLNLSLVENLKKSQDPRALLFYAGNLALMHLKLGNLTEALKYLLDLQRYTNGMNSDLNWLIEQVKLAMEENVKLGEEAVMKADVIIHEIKMGR